MQPAFTTFAEIDPLPDRAAVAWVLAARRGGRMVRRGRHRQGQGRARPGGPGHPRRPDAVLHRAAGPGTVILVLPEDHPAEQVRPRLDAAGADVTRVIDMTRLPTGARFKLSATMTKDGDRPAAGGIELKVNAVEDGGAPSGGTEE